MNDEKKEEKINPWRQIIIETDGNGIKITKNEAIGVLEFKAILNELFSRLR